MKESEKLSNKFLYSLLEQIPRVVNFKGKWVSIGAKLNHLQTQLTDFEEFSSSTSNPLCVDLLDSISFTLNDAILVAEKCCSPNLIEGKLKTQSDVDSILSKLDRLIKDGEILINSGVLSDGVVVLYSSKREAVRAETRNLLTRLQIGSTESKNSAMESLLVLLLEDDKNVVIAVAQGVVHVLVHLLDSTSLEMKEKAVAAISRVSMVESSKHVLVAEGLNLLNQLLRILESGSGFAREKACRILQVLSHSKENARGIGSRGGISSLLDICQAGTPGSQAFAASVLRNLAAFSEIRENFIEERAIFVLICLASSGTALAQENAIGCLSNLVSDDENLKLFVAKEGGIECLKNYWDSTPSLKNLEVAVHLLRHLASSAQVSEILVSDEFIARLVSVLNCSILSIRISAAHAAYELGFSTKTRKDMCECGFIEPLIKMLDGKAVEEKEAAAKALSRLLLCSDNRRVFNDKGGIVSAVQLLDPLIHNLDKKYPISVLSSLANSSKCRKQMVAAGAVVHLQKLAGVDVEGAKKLLESLGQSKIWGVFSRP